VILIPAVDIKERKCVRLRQGVSSEVTVFSDDPVSVAAHWAELGAELLHVVDLDGAFEGRPVNADIVQRICEELAIPVQLGGGIRDLASARAYFRAGVQRLIVGTMALEDPEGFCALCREFGGRVGVSLDARDGVLRSRGWVEASTSTASDVLPDLEQRGAAFVVYTDIARDGTGEGVNIPAVRGVLASTELPVIAAGGVTSLEDVQRLYPLKREGLAGLITGRAIYDGSLDFRQAVQWLRSREQAEGER
jgi:phosphoribosylformimino-5-aminoimidazole carboxamide ribotide isomerase